MKTLTLVQEWIHFVGFAAVVLMMASALTGWAVGLIFGAFWLGNAVVMRYGVSHYLS